MKVLLGQINTTPGDFIGNFNQINTGILNAVKNNCKMVIFPELSIPGYLTCDKMFQKNYIRKNKKCLQDIVSISQSYPFLYIVVGYIDYNTKGYGKPFRNMLAVISNGMILGTYQKQLLPFYDIFNEGRYYEAGKDTLVLNIDNYKVGFTICEDVWNDKDQDDYNYNNNPISEYQKMNVDIIVNISSSPYVIDKSEKRKRMLSKICKVSQYLIYVNQQGGQDELVFDGQSSVYYSGCLLYIIKNKKLKPFDEPQYKVVDLNKKYGYQSINTDIELFNNLIVGLRDYINKTGFKKVVIGSSGGIDSALVITLASLAIGPENVHAVMMPSKWSSEGSVNDARELHKNLGCYEHLVPIDHVSFLEKINDDLGLTDIEYNPIADENIQARLRGMIIMHYSNAMNALPLTTGNKTESAVGYFTLYGDSCGGFAVIKDLYKMQVYQVARYINKFYEKEIIPKNIINKAPSAELAPDQIDESSLLPYPILDNIVKCFVEYFIDDFDEFISYNKNNKIITDWSNTKGCYDKYYEIINLINKNEFKRRQTAPGIKVSKVAFGSGRIMPIACKG